MLGRLVVRLGHKGARYGTEIVCPGERRDYYNSLKRQGYYGSIPLHPLHIAVVIQMVILNGYSGTDPVLTTQFLYGHEKCKGGRRLYVTTRSYNVAENLSSVGSS